MAPSLGQQMNVVVMAIHDHLDAAGAKRLHRLVIKRARMSPVYQTMVWSYPIPGLEEINGGVGDTVLQPALTARPLAESISVTITDSWREHEGFYLILCSCNQIDVADLWCYLRNLGWKVGEVNSCKVRLKHENGR